MKIKRALSLMLTGCLLFGCLATSGCGKEENAPVSIPAVDNRKLLDGSTLITFGDSLTAFGTWPLSVAKETNMYIFNAATGGINTQEALELFDRYVEPRDADFVTLCFGMNDLLMTAKNRPQVSLEDFKKNLETLCDKIVAKGATPLLLTPSYLDESKFYSAQGQTKKHYEDVGGPLAWLDQYNEVTRTVAAERGYDLIDIRKECDAYTPEEFLDADGIHLGEVGNNVYTTTISTYLKEHYRVDPNAERITSWFPSVSSPAEPAVMDIVSYDPADWSALDPKTMTFTSGDNGELLIANTDGRWPDAQYIAEECVYVPFEGTKLVYDFSTSGANASILIFFSGSTPLATTANQWVNINSKLGVNYDTSSGDILSRQTCKGSILLSDLGIPKEAIDEKGNILISGMKIFVAGSRNQPMTVRQLAVATNGAPNR